MEKELKIPEGFKVEIDGKKVTVSYNGKSLEKELKMSSEIKMSIEGDTFKVYTDSERKKSKAMLGTVISHVKNMIKGLKDGYTYRMKIIYTHFPMNVKVEGNKVIITNFLGERTTRTARIIGDTKVQIAGQDITLTGINKEHVSQSAANIENATRISKKDRRIFQDGIYIVQSRE
ncbi:MAG: 50S ribosomal protein L6 [Candidatus Aenigmatarchaeota archaeon]|nr:50S ribosomal protein L6 [Candidatus Aenigmarchaeota archaeon]